MHKGHLLEESTIAGSIRIELVGSTQDADIWDYIRHVIIHNVADW